METMVPVDTDLHDRLNDIAQRERRPIETILEEAVRDYERKTFRRSVKESYERLRQDPVAWAGYQAELKAWDALSGDGLESEEPYYSPEEEEAIAREIAESQGG